VRNVKFIHPVAQAISHHANPEDSATFSKAPKTSTYTNILSRCDISCTPRNSLVAPVPRSALPHGFTAIHGECPADSRHRYRQNPRAGLLRDRAISPRTRPGLPPRSPAGCSRGTECFSSLAISRSLSFRRVSTLLCNQALIQRAYLLDEVGRYRANPFDNIDFFRCVLLLGRCAIRLDSKACEPTHRNSCFAPADAFLSNDDSGARKYF